MEKAAFDKNKLLADKYLQEASFSPEDEGYEILLEVFDTIYKMPMTQIPDMNDAVNQEFVKLPNGDRAWRYIRRAMKTTGGSNDEYRWPRKEDNERASFFSGKSNIGITIAKRKDGTLCLIPLDRTIEDAREIKKYFDEQGYNK